VSDLAAAGQDKCDFNLTTAFADRVLIMKNGHRLAFGSQKEVMHAELLSKAYDFPLQIINTVGASAPTVVPDLRSQA
jgi:heme transport system ATP-binding protein